VFLSALACALVPVAPVHAAFPGKNGKIAFSTDRDGNYEIYTMNADGSSPTRLTNSTAFDVLPAWSPDGTKIAFVTGTPTTSFEIYTLNADGSNRTQLTNNTAYSSGPAWSPDGTKIAFEISRDRGNTYELYTMNADGSNQTPLRSPGTSGTAGVSPAWSPDGAKIAFATNRDRDGGFRDEIYTMNADGSNQTRLTNNTSSDSGPAWSPDGSKIAFSTDRDRNYYAYEIYTMNADGSNQTRLTNDGVNAGSPRWSPDGTRIAFETTGDTDPFAFRYEIYTMNADGSNETNLTNNPAHDDAVPDWQPIPGPQRSDYNNAAQFCKAERDFLGNAAFTTKYGGGANAYGKCVSGN
jgi:Tol biopolymer transport system component